MGTLVILIRIFEITVDDRESTGSFLAVSEFAYATHKLVGITTLDGVEKSSLQFVCLIGCEVFLDQIQQIDGTVYHMCGPGLNDGLTVLLLGYRI